jgi:hypothetical protein
MKPGDVVLKAAAVGAGSSPTPAVPFGSDEPALWNFPQPTHYGHTSGSLGPWSGADDHPTVPYWYSVPAGPHPVGTFLLFGYYAGAMTADECHRRAREAKKLAAETRDLWEREMYFKIADQWQLMGAHIAAKKPPASFLKVVSGKPDPD